MRILVSENTWSMATLARQMRDEGFFVSEARDAEDLIAHVEQGQFDAVLIDPDLPDMPATRLIRRLRALSEALPICMIAREWDDRDRLRAYAAGADDVSDYPREGLELAARLRAYVRRSRGFAIQTPSFAGLTVDLDRRRVCFDGRSIHLTRLEYELIEMLALANGRLVERDAIMTKLYGWQDEPDPKIIDVYMCRIRAKLATLDAPSALIATSFGMGYRLDPFADVAGDANAA